MSTDNDSSQNQNRKRKRIITTKVSCTECFRRRQRCDPERPCSRCMQRGIGHLCVDRIQVWDTRRLNRATSIDSTRAAGSRSSRSSSVEISGNGGTVIYLDFTEVKNARELLEQIKDVEKRQFERSGMIQQLLLYSKTPWTNVFGNGLPGRISVRNDVFYSTLWQIKPPEEWRQLVRGYYFEKSADYLANTLLTNPVAWRYFLSNCQALLGIEGAETFHKCVVRKALSHTELSDSDKMLLQAMENYIKFDHLKGSAALMCNPVVQMSQEEEEIIKMIFNVESIEGSDIAILRSEELLDPSGQWINSLVECNPALEGLLGVSMKVFADIMYSLRDVPVFGALYWGFDFKFWSMLFEFSVGSAFKKPAWITEIVNLRTGTGEIVPCLMHAFASYDKISGVRNSVTYCSKPLSPTFSPKPLTEQ
jgi:hypothetical protein